MVIVAKVRNLSFKHKSGTVTLLIAALQKKKKKRMFPEGDKKHPCKITRDKNVIP
jgi:hypothetical protein